MSPYIRTVKTASGATAVQVVHSETRGSKKLTHIGSAHTAEDLALLRVKAQRLVDGDQMSLDLGVDTTPAGTGTHQAPVPVTSEKAGHLIDAITTAYRQLGFDGSSDLSVGHLGSRPPPISSIRSR